MKNSRRDWFKKAGLAALGLSLAPMEGFAINSINISAVTGGTKIRLSSNENPYGPPMASRTAMTAAVNESNRYSWDQTSRLVAAIAKKNRLAEENVLMSAGSIEMLDIAGRLAAKDKGSIVIADNTFSYWTRAAVQLGAETIEVPLTNDKKIDLGAMLKAIRPDTKLVYICNPNNPTGTVLKTVDLVNFIKEASRKAIVLVDEAYIEFTDEASIATLVKDNKNVIVTRTFSKIYGLAGARIGYALAHADTIKEMDKLQAYVLGGISAVSGAGAIAALDDAAFVEKTKVLNEAAKNYTVGEMEKLGISCIPSSTNFLYFSLADYKKDFFKLLESNSIEGTGIFEENGRWSRITIGTMEDMQKLIRAIS
ncbi:histidinol-phosphate transaminase [Flavobacterium sp. NRK1]|uniref:pyridoxal phosphate-dependent aminotransferase n=1 Tax=Flavobacterium sp. NRK1 TaxID=2954929 RepID=UPI0020932B4E|nr:histidinol-phosphate transaminase [Flavobacterium sp. NRK1]MCO6147115.1 histidinol-phosphate aminotransferase family protein [Flavobacterium sp. NRK1]